MNASRSSMQGKFRRRPVGRRRGVAAVEFAIVAPVFFLIVFCIIEICRAMMVNYVMINAA